MRKTIVATACTAFLASVLSIVCLSVGAPQAAAANTTYTVQDLGTLGGASIARDINASGQVVGQSQNASGQAQAFLWENGRMTNLGTLGGPTSFARGIDDSGRVVGFSRTSSTNNQVRAFLWENGNMTSRGTLPGYASGEAWHINDSGVAVGRSFSSTTQGQAVLWENDQTKNLGASLSTPYSEAWSINDRGQVVGEAGSVDQQAKAFLYDNNTGEVTDLDAVIRASEPTAFPYSYSEAMGINNGGQVVGWSYRTTRNDPPSTPPGPEGKAFLYEKGADGTADVMVLGPLEGDLYSRARDVNDSGWGVGWSRGLNGNEAEQFSAILWKDEKATDLNDLIPADSDWKLTDAYAINESGQIVGAGFKAGNGGSLSQLRAFLLTPDITNPSIECGISDGLWHKEDVSIACTASDDGVGLAETDDAEFMLSTNVPDGTETANAYTDSRKVCDAAGNCAIVGPITGNKVDKKAPEIAIATSPGDDEYTLEADVTVSYDCLDAGSGTAYCSGPVVSGGKLDTALVGQHAFTVQTGDEAGNVGSRSLSYNVIYAFSGFFGPVDNPDVLNRVKAGSAIPVKFSLGGDQGLDIFAEADGSSFPRSGPLPCDSTDPVDVIEQTVGANSSGLTYDTTTQRYTYVWKTSRAWTGCRQLVIRLHDGEEYRANFEFTR